MTRMSLVRTLLASLLFGMIVVTPFQPSARDQVGGFFLEVSLTSPANGYVQLFHDTGVGFNEVDSSKHFVTGGAAPRLYRFELPSARYRALRFDPTDQAVPVTFSGMRIVDHTGRVVRTFSKSDFLLYHQVQALQEVANGTLQMIPTPGAGDPILIVSFEDPLQLRLSKHYIWSLHLRNGLIVAALVFGAAWFLSTRATARRWLASAAARAARHPTRAVMLVALAAIVLNTYPVIFLGKSYVSPNYGTSLLYDQWPTLPGYSDNGVQAVGGSDVGAILWHHVPCSMFQREALFDRFELPLWNRYNSSGNPLLGQGQSSFGDPLNLIPTIANGRAWAWDMKFLLAKWLFAIALGLIVWTATRHLGAALLVSAFSPFIGFFVFRVNHPAFFSLCYAPWILYAWQRLAGAPDWRRVSIWASLLMVASWSELMSGTAKEAVILLLGMNFTGLVVALCADLDARGKAARIGAAAAAGVALLLIASPHWVTFLQVLAKSFTAYEEPQVYQVPPGLFLALFDEILLRAFHFREGVTNGSLSLLALAGCAYALLRVRVLWHDRFFRGLCLSILPCVLVLYGAVPPQWLAKVPLLANIIHLDNTLVCVLIVQLWAVAGYGYAEAARRLGTPEGRGDLVCVVALVLVAACAYLGTSQAVQRSSRAFLKWGNALHSEGFVYAYVGAAIAGVVLVLATARSMLMKARVTPAAATLFALGALLACWRHGLHAGHGFEKYVVHPTSRADFHARSAAVEAVQADKGDPFRVIGTGGNMFQGWTGVYGFEGISGPDALVNPLYREILAACQVPQDWNWRYVLDSVNIRTLRPILDFLGVKYYFDRRTDPAAAGPHMVPVLMADLDVYRSETVWPRAFFSNRVLPYEKPTALADHLRKGSAPFASMERSEATDAGLSPLFSADPAQQKVVPAHRYVLSTNSTTFVVDAPTSGLAVLHETYVPNDIRVTVNGKAAQAVRVNHAFRGVHLPTSGTYSITFTYWPEHMTLTLIAAAAALVLWVFACILAPRLPARWLGVRAEFGKRRPPGPLDPTNGAPAPSPREAAL